MLEPQRITCLEDDAVVLLDQRRLPDTEVELRCPSCEEVAEASRTLAVRGAPAIGIGAAYGHARAAHRGEDLDFTVTTLAVSRRTAANLSSALEEMRPWAGDPADRAPDIHSEEIDRRRRIAEHAASLVGACAP
jgi:methylthioribose-1-phosphate isomerase